MYRKFIVASVLVMSVCLTTADAQFTFDTSGSYTQNFNTLTTLPTGWDVRTGAGATALGTAGATFNSTPATNTSWGDTAGAFKNMASATGLTGAESVATQTAATDRALGVRQTSAFGDPGAAFTFVANTTNVQTITSVSLDAMMMSVQPRSTTWTIRYSLGDTPTTFTTLGTFSDPGTFGTTNLNFTGLTITPDASQLINFQIAAVGASTGSGNRDSFAIDNFTVVYTVPVPEPASMLIAVLGFGLVARRFRSAGV